MCLCSSMSQPGHAGVHHRYAAINIISYQTSTWRGVAPVNHIRRGGKRERVLAAGRRLFVGI